MTIAVAATTTKTATHVCMPTPSPHGKGGYHSNRANHTLQRRSLTRPWTRAGTLRDRLPRRPTKNPSCAQRHLCCARLVRQRAHAVRALCAARNLCLHRLCSREIRGSLHPTWARRGRLPERRLPDLPGNSSPWNQRCQPYDRPSNRNMEGKRLAIRPNRYALVRAVIDRVTRFQMRHDLFRALSGNHGAYLVHAGPMNIRNAAELAKELLCGAWTYAGDFAERGLGLAFGAPVAMESH